MWFPTPPEHDPTAMRARRVERAGMIDPAVHLSILVLVAVATVVLALVLFSRVG